MARTRDVVISSKGVVYRMTRTNWKSFLEALAAGHTVTLGEKGAKKIVTVDRDVTSFSALDAQSALSALSVTDDGAEAVAA